jgi:hypothetical protein
MKESDCNKTQIFYPKTKRCINKNTKKAIEYLFNNGNSSINKLYEMVDGKIVKRCEKTKIRNPETKRCVKVKISKKEKSKKVEDIKKAKKVINAIDFLYDKGDKAIHTLYEKVDGKLVKKCEKPNVRSVNTNKCIKPKINKSVSLDKKIEAVKKARKAIIPFANRISADIYHRNKYLMLMRRELKNRSVGCMRIYKKNLDKTFSYRIGNRIILKKRIGTDSVYGIVYLSEFREKEKKVFTFASKVYEYVEKRAKMELELLTKMTNLVRMDMCPHFPILYGYVMCEKISNFDNDSFVKSNPKDKSFSKNLKNYPDLIKINKDKKIITTFNELANGDLWNFLKVYGTNTKILINAIIQKLLSIMFFNYYTSRIHSDCHPGNFLYHKIKQGGYFHYNLFGKDYYLENLGILWVIWDFDLSKTLNDAMAIHKVYKTKSDYIRILSAYLPMVYNGYCRDTNILLNNKLLEFTYKIYYHHEKFYENFNNKKGFLNTIKNIFKKKEEKEKKVEKVYNAESLKEYILSLPLLLSDIKVDGINYLLKTLPKGATIINKSPYKMSKTELFK